MQQTITIVEKLLAFFACLAFPTLLILLLFIDSREKITEQTCDGKPTGFPCWMALADRPSCYVWNPSYSEYYSSVTWSGMCRNGFAEGEGTLTWPYLHPFFRVVLNKEEKGHLHRGKKEGEWVERMMLAEELHTWRGPYVKGKRHGKWEVVGLLTRKVWGGPYVKGKRHGHWIGYLMGLTTAGTYVDDERHGEWVYRHLNGYQSKGVYRNGEPDGVWLDYDSLEDQCYSVTYHQGERVKKKRVNKKMCLVPK